MSELSKKVVKTYTFVPEDNAEHEVFKIILEETLFESQGHIEIIDRDLTPIDVLVAEKLGNHYIGAKLCLEERAMQPNRMFLAEYCEKHGLNVESLDDRLSISRGRIHGDNLCLIITEEVVDV